MHMDQSLFVAIFVGCIAGIMIGLVTEYYTAGKPVEWVAEVLIPEQEPILLVV